MAKKKTVMQIKSVQFTKTEILEALHKLYPWLPIVAHIEWNESVGAFDVRWSSSEIRGD